MLNRKLCSQLITVFCLVSFLSVINVSAKKKKVEKCQSCNNLVESLVKNLEKTAKGNFGGGNTDWEDRKLGNYLTSETRFEEIIEHICDDSECHKLLEEYEEDLLDWFKNKQNEIKDSFRDAFCVQKLQYCCQKDRFGKKCEPCPMNLDQVCSGNGNCDGSGSRSGSGNCSCNEGYNGESCGQCSSGFFEESKSENSLKCTACHKSCKSTCLKSGSDGCIDCKDGWTFEDGGCKDINECLDASTCDESSEFCDNSEGSFMCKKCDSSCNKCTGRGAGDCIECREGFTRDEEKKCVDIDECAQNDALCGDYPCVNIAGSYECTGNLKNSCGIIFTEYCF